MQANWDTICAIATAPGRGGVGIVRVSGPLASTIAEMCTGKTLKPRYAQYCGFQRHDSIVDHGIALFFKAPHSFTGEDVFEFQGHGGPVILDLILEHCVHNGARLARPGEFSERAFLNDKIDLAQAEAIADLIDANSRKAALQAVNSLQGAFAKTTQQLLEDLTQLRLYVESAIDFPEEEIDFLGDGVVSRKLEKIIAQTHDVCEKAKQGAVIRDGMKVVLAGKPNTGKSTLLNALVEKEIAIVTDIEGTTRDTLTEHIHINGMPLHITDTAGIRKTESEVEQIGIQRAWSAMASADKILLLVDAQHFNRRTLEQEWPEFFNDTALLTKLTILANKVDLTETPVNIENQDIDILPISAKSGEGLDSLRHYLLDTMGVDNVTEGGFSARRRHLDALERCQVHLHAGQDQLNFAAAGELLAEELKCAQNALSEITGKFTADDLLGKIFSSFCIGK